MRLLKVGRDANCDIVLHSDKASALHAEITILNNGDILLEDKNSRNGTFVMNRPIKPGTQVSVKRGDAIRFGDVELIWNQIPMPEDLSNYKAVYGIGTSMRNDIQIAGNTVSRYHATLKIDRKGKAYLQDHSKNGSTINGERLNPGQTRQIKRGDSIVCGGVPVNLTQFIPSNNLSTIIGIAASIAVLVVCGWAGWKYIPWSTTVSPVTTQAMENASVCIYGGYYYEITVKDDPFKGQIKGWPEKWYVGYDAEGSLKVSLSTSNLIPLQYHGTAFFISEYGELGTNRHIAIPWEYRTDEEEELIKQEMEKARLDMLNVPINDTMTLGGLLSLGDYLGNPDLQAWKSRYQKSPIEIGGIHEYLGVGLTGAKINKEHELMAAQVIAESGDPDRDVAIIRLKTPVTPPNLVKMGAIYDISQARTNEQKLIPQKEELLVTGYPMGTTVSDQVFKGQELHPTTKGTKVSQKPDDNIFQIQTDGIGGMSGSPVCDKSHRLVGVLCKGFRNTDMTFCCNIKHLVELYNKNRVRE